MRHCLSVEALEVKLLLDISNDLADVVLEELVEEACIGGQSNFSSNVVDDGIKAQLRGGWCRFRRFALRCACE